MEVTSQYHTPWSPDAPPDWKMHNKGITPIFFTESVNLYELDGKTPRHGPDGKCTREQEYVRILIAGDGLCEAAHIVDDLLRERFADEYQAWKENRETAHSRHTIEEWPAIFSSKHGDLPPPKQIAELHAANIFTVEDLAALSDVNLYAIHHGLELREKAIAWLADKEGHAVTDKLAEQNAAMAGELEALRRQMAKMEAERKPKRKKQMSGAMRRKLNEARVRKAPVPAEPLPPTEAVQSATSA
jgi:hypothetical protein